MTILNAKRSVFICLHLNGPKRPELGTRMEWVVWRMFSRDGNPNSWYGFSTLVENTKSNAVAIYFESEIYNIIVNGPFKLEFSVKLAPQEKFTNRLFPAYSFPSS
ncbi:hypothetical protein CDAR_580081 [Caerostris darwini]|uniref:Uncharacterized protein n=1 Tax=Caerostris darwini TaxID=1538125 RepID=A0AAV4PNC5_9ARAC|nr:hypothetical protein CDAR_580081 [Caerostris darwini]